LQLTGFLRHQESLSNLSEAKKEKEKEKDKGKDPLSSDTFKKWTHGSLGLEILTYLEETSSFFVLTTERMMKALALNSSPSSSINPAVSLKMRSWSKTFRFVHLKSFWIGVTFSFLFKTWQVMFDGLFG
jgi:hypothetical protein